MNMLGCRLPGFVRQKEVPSRIWHRKDSARLDEAKDPAMRKFQQVRSLEYFREQEFRPHRLHVQTLFLITGHLAPEIIFPIRYGTARHLVSKVSQAA